MTIFAQPESTTTTYVYVYVCMYIYIYIYIQFSLNARDVQPSSSVTNIPFLAKTDFLPFFARDAGGPLFQRPGDAFAMVSHTGSGVATMHLLGSLLRNPLSRPLGLLRKGINQLLGLLEED